VKASKILTTAMKDITTDRAKSYGPMHTNMKNIATLWSAYLDVPIEAAQVPIMMALLKIGRTKYDVDVPDNFVDLAGYAAIAGQLNGGE